VWRGYQATRSELDRILLDRARAAGAEIHRPARAMDVVVENGRTVGVRTSSGVFGTSFVVDAAGPGHWLQRRLELPVLEVSNPLIARFGWESIADQHDGAPEFHVLGCGWRWEAPVQTGKCAWVALELDRISKCRGTKARDVTWRMVRPCAGAGYFLAGDAAFVLDPACSHGVLKALISGVEAGNAAARVLTQGADESAVKATYCSWMESWFCGDASALLSLYADFAPAPSWLESAREALRYISMNPFL
jgi:flavin-dependent dehydrogenase